MRKVLIIIMLASSANAFGYQATLGDQQTVSVDSLVKGGATYVTCENPKPRCYLKGYQYGIQYPGQTLDEVKLTNDFSTEGAAEKLVDLKSKGLCE